MSGNNFDVPSYTGNPVLVCQVYESPSSITFNGVSMTKQLDINPLGNRLGSVWTLANPSVGNFSLVGNTGMAQCFLISGVDITNPILDYSFANGQSFSPVITKATTTADNLILDFYAMYHDWGCTWAVNSFGGSTYTMTANACYSNTKYWYNVSTATGETFSNSITNYDNNYWYYLVL